MWTSEILEFSINRENDELVLQRDQKWMWEHKIRDLIAKNYVTLPFCFNSLQFHVCSKFQVYLFMKIWYDKLAEKNCDPKITIWSIEFSLAKIGKIQQICKFIFHICKYSWNDHKIDIFLVIIPYLAGIAVIFADFEIFFRIYPLLIELPWKWKWNF